MKTIKANWINRASGGGDCKLEGEKSFKHLKWFHDPYTAEREIEREVICAMDGDYKCETRVHLPPNHAYAYGCALLRSAASME